MGPETRPTRRTMGDGLWEGDAPLLLGLGFAVWLVATIAVRLVGGVVLDPARPRVVAGLFVLAIPAVAALTIALFRWLDPNVPTRTEAATLLVLPGMVLDAIVVPFYEGVFPTIEPEGAASLGGLLLLTYAIVLLVGVVTEEDD